MVNLLSVRKIRSLGYVWEDAEITNPSFPLGATGGRRRRTSITRCFEVGHKRVRKIDPNQSKRYRQRTGQ